MYLLTIDKQGDYDDPTIYGLFLTRGEPMREFANNWCAENDIPLEDTNLTEGEDKIWWFQAYQFSVGQDFRVSTGDADSGVITEYLSANESLSPVPIDYRTEE